MDILNDPEALKKLHAYFTKKRNIELVNHRYAGSCYEILVKYQAVAIVAVDVEDNAINSVVLAFIKGKKLYEYECKKQEIVDFLLDNPEIPVGTPNFFGSPTKVSVVNSTYLRSDANDTLADNLGNLPSIDQWQVSEARKILQQLVVAISHN